MPDLITHVAAAYFLKKLFRISRYTGIFFAGVILPDILTRPFYILFPGSYWFVYPLHTPFVLILVSALISYFFDQKIRRMIFTILLAGIFFHLLLDLFQRHLIGFNYWLFPFSDIDVGVPLYWQDDSVYAIPLLLSIVVLIGIFSSPRFARRLWKAKR